MLPEVGQSSCGEVMSNLAKVELGSHKLSVPWQFLGSSRVSGSLRH